MSANHESFPILVAVASGKGGVGKTLLTANLAWSLAEDGRSRVVAVDLDLGCGNLNSCLGVPYPERNLGDFLAGRVEGLQELLLDTPLENLFLISTSYRGTDPVDLRVSQRRKLVAALRALQADWILLDLGAGVSSLVLDLYAEAHLRLLVTTPESLALHNAFLFLKGALYRCLWRELQAEEFLWPIRRKLKELVYSNGKLNVPEVLERLREWDRYSAYIVAGLMRDLSFGLVGNMFRAPSDRFLLERFQGLVAKYLGLKENLSWLGCVDYEETIRRCQQNLSPFLGEASSLRAAQQIRSIGERLRPHRT